MEQSIPLSSIIDRIAEEGGSDLHLSPGRKPYMRDASGILRPLDEYPPVSSDAICTCLVVYDICPKSYLPVPNGPYGDFDTNFTTETAHARVNIFQEERGYAASFRILRDKIPDNRELHIPSGIRNLAEKRHGLVAFCGPTGSGKTTSIASLVESINRERSAHIITLEDPVEYRYSHAKSLVSQREVGLHCSSFLEGLRAALREDPDVIVIGEMRDNETIRTALAAAETGHLVFTTLHAPNTIEAVDRFLQYFPMGEHELIQAQLANSFEAIIAQQLLPSTSGGKVPAFEVVVRNTATVNLIRNGEHHKLVNYFKAGNGMMSFEDSMESLQLRGLLPSR